MDDTLGLDDSEQYIGLTTPTYSTPEMGDVGDGAGQPSDWLSSALATTQQGIQAASDVATLLNGGQVAQQGTMIVPLNSTAGYLQGLNTVQNTGIAAIPGWIWAILGGGFLLSVALLSRR
ncbi:MAG: hypothetical protein ACREL1_00360 [bacterium]